MGRLKQLSAVALVSMTLAGSTASAAEPVVIRVGWAVPITGSLSPPLGVDGGLAGQAC